jgi:hypothetical protein
MIVCPNDLKILKNQIKFEIYEICQYLMISYVKVTAKTWMTFEQLLSTILVSQNMKFHSATKDMVRFAGDAKFNLSFDFKTCFYKQ